MAESNSQAREQFEGWARRAFSTAPGDFSSINGEYVTERTQLRWEAWQAALSSMSAEREALRTALQHCLERATGLDPFTEQEARAALQGTQIAREAGL